MTLWNSDLQSDSELDRIHNSCELWNDKPQYLFLLLWTQQPHRLIFRFLYAMIFSDA